MTLKKQVKEIDLWNFKYYIDSTGINKLTRKREVLWSRYICYNFLYNCGFSLAYTGSLFDKSSRVDHIDHATVLNGLKQYEKQKRYQDFQALMERIEPELERFLKHNVADTVDVCLNEMISLAYLESEMQKKYTL